MTVRYKSNATRNSKGHAEVTKKNESDGETRASCHFVSGEKAVIRGKAFYSIFARFMKKQFTKFHILIHF